MITNSSAPVEWAAFVRRFRGAVYPVPAALLIAASTRLELSFRIRFVPSPLTTPEVTAALERFRQLVCSRFGARLREITVFGSRASGDAREDSDVDLLVVVDRLSERERGEVFDLAWTAAMAGEEYVVLAPIPYSSERAAELRRLEKRLMREIDSQGIPLERAS